VLALESRQGILRILPRRRPKAPPVPGPTRPLIPPEPIPPLAVDIERETSSGIRLPARTALHPPGGGRVYRMRLQAVQCLALPAALLRPGSVNRRPLPGAPHGRVSRKGGEDVRPGSGRPRASRYVARPRLFSPDPHPATSRSMPQQVCQPRGAVMNAAPPRRIQAARTGASECPRATPIRARRTAPDHPRTVPGPPPRNRLDSRPARP
jgi:hypothetical protein